MKSIYNILTVAFIIFGLWIIFSGFDGKKYLEHKSIYKDYQENIYTQVYHIKQIHRYSKKIDFTKEDKKKLKTYLEDLENLKCGLLSQIETFPNDLDTIKEHARILFRESEIIYEHYKTDFKNVADKESFSENFEVALNKAVKTNYDCSIICVNIESNLKKKSFLTQVLTK